MSKKNNTVAPKVGESENNVLKSVIEKNTENAAAAVAVVEKRNNGLTTIDLNGSLPDLALAEAYAFDLMADYWTPEKPMESKRVFFDKIDSRIVLDQLTNQHIQLECAFFLEQKESGGEKTICTVSNGSKRLVGAIESSNIQRGTPLLITYLGKKKNSSNNFQSDNWSVKPLRVNL